MDAAGSSKPPKIPASSSNKVLHQQPNLYSSTSRSGTPPRAAFNPGTQVDRNFVTEDWDNEETSSKADSKSSSDNRSKSNYGTVQADDNWLNDDFDES
jgi:hypothetical protein